MKKGRPQGPLALGTPPTIRSSIPSKTCSPHTTDKKRGAPQDTIGPGDAPNSSSRLQKKWGAPQDTIGPGDAPNKMHPADYKKNGAPHKTQ